jgi:PAS domain S-box-containing protein
VKPPRQSSIKSKVMLAIMLASVTVLLVTVAAFMVYDVVTFRDAMRRNLETEARLIAENSTASVSYQIEKDARDVLNSLRAEPHITAAAIYDNDGKLFVKYPPQIADAGLPVRPQDHAPEFVGSHLDVFQPIVQSGRRMGTVYLRSDLTALSQRSQLYGLISLLIIIGSLLVAFWLSTTLQRRISNPIIALAETARTISDQQDFSVRAKKTSDDELGDLTGAFNTMLDQIQRSHSALRESETRLSAIFNQAGAGIAQCDLSGRFLKVNDRYCEITGYKREDLLKMAVQDITYPEDREESVSALKTVNQGSQPPILEKRYIRPDGGVVWARVSVAPLRDAQGDVEFALSVAQDITEKKHAEESVRRLAAIVESSDDAIVSKNLNGIIASWNHGAERIFGYRADEVIGRSITILMPPERWNEEPDILERIRRGDRVEHYETIRQRKDGTLIEVSLTISPIKDASGKVIGASKIGRDITRQKQSERELEHVYKEVVAASRAKDDFLAALSHELRTPLNPVLLLASASAEDDQLPAEIREQFVTIRNNVELEARLIDDLLDLTKITRGKLSLEMRPQDVRTVLQAAIAIVQDDADKKKISLILDLKAEQHMIAGDSVRLQQIFWNVLKNAVKFTPENGRITIQTRTLPESGNVAINIIDTGIGLTGAEIGHIFNAFTQGDHAAKTGSHRFGGLGLGLTISRMLVELHAGAIHAASPGRDQGATFTIEFPCKPLEAANNDSAHPKLPPENSKTLLKKKTGWRILLVEDHEPTRMALTQLLTRRDYKVMSATTVAGARGLAQREKFDLVVSDIGLPDGDGYALMAELRDKFGLKGIALSGYGMEQDVAKGQDAGFVAHLIKPVRVEALEKTLDEVSSNICRQQ